MISSLKCKKRQQRKSHSKIAIGYFQQQQRLEFMKEVPFWQQSKKSSRNRCFSRKKGLQQKLTISVGEKEKEFQDQILLPLPSIHRRKVLLLLRIKGILARVHFCEIPLRSGRVELRWLRWQMQSSSSVSVMCSYLRQRAAAAASSFFSARTNQCSSIPPHHQLWVSEIEMKCQQHYILFQTTFIGRRTYQFLLFLDTSQCLNISGIFEFFRQTDY